MWPKWGREREWSLMQCSPSLSSVTDATTVFMRWTICILRTQLQRASTAKVVLGSKAACWHVWHCRNTWQFSPETAGSIGSPSIQFAIGSDRGTVVGPKPHFSQKLLRGEKFADDRWRRLHLSGT